MASNINHQDAVDEIAPDYDILPQAKVQENELDDKKVADVEYRRKIYEDMCKTNELLLATLRLVKKRKVKKDRKNERRQKKIEKLQQLNEELKKSAEVMQKIVKGQYMIQEALDKKVQRLERELYQARMKN